MVFSAKCQTPIYFKANGVCACGFFLEFGLSWIKANDRCKALGARLPVVISAQENQDIARVAVSTLLSLNWCYCFISLQSR